MLSAAEDGGSVDHMQSYLRGQHEAYEWLTKHGAEFDTVKISSGQSTPRSHRTEISQLLTTLVDVVESLPNVQVLYSHRAKSLLTDTSGGVCGAVVEDAEGQTTQYRSGRGVILATGGFSRSVELLAKYVPGQVGALPYGGIGNTGDGLAMAAELEAGVMDMEYVSGTYGSHPETTIEEHELLTAFYMGAVIVNTSGERFVDESVSYKKLGAACLQQPHELAFQIFDMGVRQQSQPGVALSDIGHIEAKGHVIRAESLDELARLIDVDPAALVATIDRYNSAIANGIPDEFGRTGLCNGVGELRQLVEPPFYAYPAKTLMTSTFGGVRTDPCTRVLKENGSPIAGLYAVGEVAGGFHGAGYVTGTALTKAVICALTATRTIDESAYGPSTLTADTLSGAS
jgi:fumarate reductase flavoprotein subunit